MVEIQEVGRNQFLGEEGKGEGGEEGDKGKRGARKDGEGETGREEVWRKEAEGKEQRRCILPTVANHQLD